MHPTPYTAEQIRAATKPGRMYRYRVEFTGSPPFERKMTFVSVDAGGATIAETGQPQQRFTWEELRKHAEFPAATVQTHDERVTVPAGTFECVAYVLHREGEEETTFYFAKTMPGAPVKYVVNVSGHLELTTTLVEHRPGIDDHANDSR